MKQYLRNWLADKHFASLEWREEGHFVLSQFRYLNAELDLGQVLHLTELSAIKDKLPKNVPMGLVVNNTQVLRRLIKEPLPESEEVAIMKAFPNLDLTAFYCEICVFGDAYIVNVAKKSFVDGLVAAVQKEGLALASLSIGLGAAAQLLPYVQEQEISISGALLQLEQGSISNMELTEEEVAGQFTVDQSPLDSAAFLGFAITLRYLSKASAVGNVNDQNKRLQNDQFNRTVFTKGFQAALVFFLLLLAVNFGLFQHLEKMNNELYAQLQISKSKTEQLTQLESRVAQKEEKLRSVQSQSGTRTTYLVDQVAASIPSSVRLSEMVYQPLNQPINTSRAIDLQQGVIAMTGTSTNQERFTSWTASLEELEWVTHVVIEDYSYQSRTTSAFTIQLILQDEKAE
jgi:Tfp pilus assembly protein PilN